MRRPPSPARGLRGLLLVMVFTMAGLTVVRTDASAASGGTSQELAHRLLGLLQSDSAQIDQAFVIDLSGSVQAILPISRKMMREFISTHARDGDTLMVVAVGTRPRVVLDGVTIDGGNRPRLLEAVDRISPDAFGPGFSDHTDLDAAMYRTLRRFDDMNHDRASKGLLPNRQVVEVFSDFIKDPPAGSPHARPGSPASKALEALSRRLVLRQTIDAASIQAEHAIDLHGVPLAIKSSDFRVPEAASSGHAVGSFEAWLGGLAARFDPRAGLPLAGEPASGPPRLLQQALADNLQVGLPTGFRSRSDGPGVVADLPVTNGFRSLQVRELGLASASGGPEPLELVLPEGRTTLAPGETINFEVILPELVEPGFMAEEPARYASRSLSVALLGHLESVATGSPAAVSLEDVMAPVTRMVDLEIPPDARWRQVLLGLLGAALLAFGGFLVSRSRGPTHLDLELELLDPATGELRSDKVMLARGGKIVIGGERETRFPSLRKTEALLEVERRGQDIGIRSLAHDHHVVVEGRPLSAGQHTGVPTRATVRISKFSGGELLWELQVARPRRKSAHDDDAPGDREIPGSPPQLPGEDFGSGSSYDRFRRR